MSGDRCLAADVGAFSILSFWNCRAVVRAYLIKIRPVPAAGRACSELAAGVEPATC